MIFVISLLILVISIMLVRTNAGKKELISSALCALMLSCCFMVSSSAVMTAIHIPANSITVSVVNVIVAFCFMFYTKKKGVIQGYYFEIMDCSAFGLIAIVAFLLWRERFSKSFDLVFETSDPGVHLKNIMDFVNSQKVAGLFLPQIEFGLLIEALVNDINKISMMFEVIYGFNFFMAGAICYIIIRGFTHNSIQKIIGVIISLFYMIGYPYNDMLFGFCYLQIAITYIGLVYILSAEYCDENCESKTLYRIYLAISCASVGVGYTLFVPVVFVALLAIVTVKAITAHMGVITWIRECLSIFLFPSLLIIWSVFFSTNDNYIGGLAIEGYIYRNLYSDFLFCIIPVMCFYFHKKKNDINLFQYAIPLYILYYLIFFVRMLNNGISTYYFYKLNYLGALFFITIGAAGIFLLSEKTKGVAYSFVLVPAVLFGLYNSQIEQKMFAENINYSPFIEADTFFHINDFNNIIKDRRTQISEQFVDICKLINDGDSSQKVIYIGDWMYTYWFEALTNQRFEKEIQLTDYNGRYNNYISNKYGRFAILEKNDLSKSIISEFNGSIIYENSFAYILDIGEAESTDKYKNEGISRYTFLRK